MNHSLATFKRYLQGLLFYTVSMNLHDSSGIRIHRHYCWSYRECLEWMACYSAQDYVYVTAGFSTKLVARRGCRA